MQQYKELIERILTENAERIAANNPRKDRTGVGRYSIFGHMMRFNLSENAFPLVTTKFTPFKTMVSEIKWFISGSTNIRPLALQKNRIWDEWGFQRYLESGAYEGTLKPSDLNSTDEKVYQQVKKEMDEYIQRIVEDEEFAAVHGELGEVYGKQWRSIIGPDGEEFDQLMLMLEELKNNPMSTRLILDSWTIPSIYTSDLTRRMKLPPCHFTYQAFVDDFKNELSGRLVMRSNDVPIGGPINYSGYALLTMVIAKLMGYEPGELVVEIGDAHIYADQVEAMQELLKREPKPLPKINLTVRSIEDWDVELIDYQHHPKIPMRVAV